MKGDAEIPDTSVREAELAKAVTDLEGRLKQLASANRVAVNEALPFIVAALPQVEEALEAALEARYEKLAEHIRSSLKSAEQSRSLAAELAWVRSPGTAAPIEDAGRHDPSDSARVFSQLGPSRINLGPTHGTRRVSAIHANRVPKRAWRSPESD